MAKSTKKQNKSFEWRSLWEGRRKWFVISPACLLLMLGGWYAYTQLTVLPPAEASKSEVKDVVGYIGDERGLIQMPVQQREQYLARTWQYYAQSSPEQRMQVAQAMQRMTPRQKEVFTQAVTGVAKKHILEGAKKYNGMKSAGDKQRFANQFYDDFNKMRNEVMGTGTMAPGMNVTTPMNDMAPTSPEGVQKAILNSTTPRERATAGGFVEKLAEVHKDKIQLSRGG